VSTITADQPIRSRVNRLGEILPLGNCFCTSGHSLHWSDF
jgi:hypothetical protein